MAHHPTQQVSARSVPGSTLPEQAAQELRDTRSRWIDRIVTVVTVVAAVFAIGLLVSSAVGWVRVDTENSGSMAPQIAIGSDVLVAPEPASQVHIGQVIAYTPPNPYPQETIIHKVVSIKRALGRTVVTTRGVANPTNDPWQAVLPATTWYVVATVPDVGGITNFARAGIIQVIILIIVGIVIATSLQAWIVKLKGRNHEKV